MSTSAPALARAVFGPVARERAMAIIAAIALIALH